MNEFIAKQIVVENYLINYYTSLAESPSLNVVFIHGWLSNSTVWFHLMHALKKVGINSYALDLPGFGASQIPNESVDNSFYANVVNEFILKLNLGNVVVIGHSNGGAIAVKSILSNQNIKKLILIDAAGIRSKSVSKVIKTMGAKLIKPFFVLPFTKNLRKRIYSSIGSADYLNSEYLKDTYKNVITEDISNLYQNINVPTLIIWGNKDTDTPIKYADFIKSQIKNSDLKVIDAGHFPFIDKPDQVINYLVNFLK